MDKASPTIATSLSSTTINVGASAKDSSTITGGFNPSGTLTYALFTGATCSGTGTSVSTVSVTGGQVPDSTVHGFSAAGSYSWNAAYGGDGNNNGSTSSCEPLTVKKASPTITNALSKTAISSGDSITDSAAVTGGFQPGGFVTYQFFPTQGCIGSATVVGLPVIVSNGSVPNSAPQTFAGAGTYSLAASYGGDPNNSPAVSNCQTLTVFPLPTLRVPGDQTITAGSTITFVVNATGAGGCNGVTIAVAPTLPDGAHFDSGRCFSGAASSVFSWTPPDSLTPGDYRVTFMATDTRGSVARADVTIHVAAPSKAAPLPLLSYSIFGIVGFLAVIGIAIMLRRFQTPKKK